MKQQFKMWTGAFIIALSATSCVTDGFGKEDWDVPTLACNNKYEAANMSLADFVAQAPSNGSITITEDQIIDGYVISSDENGSFYKTISFQDKPENPSIGLQIEINKSNNYLDFPVGTHIRINAKGLVLGKDRGVIKLGSVDPEFAIGRISEAQLGNHLSVVCSDNKADIVQIKPIELNSLQEAKNDIYINKLVSVPNVQFVDTDILGEEGVKSYLNVPKADTNRELIDNDKKTAILRVSQYASFGTEKLPTGNGRITFVVSKYNSTFQMMIRSTADIDFSNERKDFAPAKGGNNITYLREGDIENFNSYTATGVNSETFPKYINDPVIGDRYWRIANFRGNKYIQFSYGATGAKPFARTFFAIPVDFDNMNHFSFKTKDGFYNGDVLKVYYSTDYKANAINPNLVDITKHFNIAKGTTTGYANYFTDSGVWVKPNDLKGKGYIIFEYVGGDKKPTTTMQIDDISLNNNEEVAN